MAPKTTLFHLQISVFPWFFEEHQTQFSQLIKKLKEIITTFFPHKPFKKIPEKIFTWICFKAA